MSTDLFIFLIDKEKNVTHLVDVSGRYFLAQRMHTFSGVLKKEKEKTSSSLVASEPGGPGGRNLGWERQASSPRRFQTEVGSWVGVGV